MGEKLTVISEFHSHLESMKRIPKDELDNQITFSYISPPIDDVRDANGEDTANVVNLSGPFPISVDPTR